MNVTRALVGALTAEPVARLFRPFVANAVPIFMLHRFTDSELGSEGMDPKVLRSQLEYLRRNRFDVVPVSELANGAARRRPAVAFTVDDGYLDFKTVAAPIFAEFDCPVTVFVVTGAVDDDAWLWWDKVSFAFAKTQRSLLDVELGAKRLRFDWSDGPEAFARAESMFIEALKAIPDSEKIETLNQLDALLDVSIPPKPPRGFKVMTWEEMRAFPAGGLVTFGPHTVTHPILPMANDVQAEREIVGSWERLRDRCPSTSPVFCYPNGSYSRREVSILETSGLIGALTSEFRYASNDAFSAAHSRRRYTVPRVAAHDPHRHFVQIVNGIERVKLMARRGRAGWSTSGASQ